MTYSQSGCWNIVLQSFLLCNFLRRRRDSEGQLSRKLRNNLPTDILTYQHIVSWFRIDMLADI